MQVLSGKTIQGEDGDEEDSLGDLSLSKRKSTASLNSIQSKDKVGVEEMPKKGKEKQRKGKGERKKVSKRPLLVASTPEPSISELGPVGDTFSDYAMEDGGRSSDVFTSENEGSVKDFSLEKLDIEDDSQGASLFLYTGLTLIAPIRC